MENILTGVKGFFEQYGGSFAMMVLAGFIIACIVELGVKSAFRWLEEKLGEQKYLTIARIGVIFLVTVLGSFASTRIIMNGSMELPGNSAFGPFWFFIIYISQYVFSMYGIKAILKIKDAPKKEKEPKEPKPKKVSPVEGMTKIAHNVYRAEDGSLYNKKGEKL